MLDPSTLAVNRQFYAFLLLFSGAFSESVFQVPIVPRDSVSLMIQGRRTCLCLKTMSPFSGLVEECYASWTLSIVVGSMMAGQGLFCQPARSTRLPPRHLYIKGISAGHHSSIRQPTTFILASHSFLQCPKGAGSLPPFLYGSSAFLSYIDQLVLT